MDANKQNYSLKTIIAVLLILLVGCGVYIYRFTTENNQLTSALKVETSEKDKVLQGLENLKATYDSALAEKTTLSDDLTAERDKVEKLISDLKKSNGSVANLQKFKSQYFVLESKMKSLVAENEGLKVQNGTLTVQRDSIENIKNEAVKDNQTLATQNGELSKTVEKAQKLTVLNLRTLAFKQRSSGKQIDTEKASRADVLKISFTIAENAVAKAGDKTYQIQVIDNNNNVLGDKKIENYGEKSLTYSFAKTITYQNKTVDITEDLPVKDLSGGSYFVNVFDKGELVSKTSFTLK